MRRAPIVPEDVASGAPVTETSAGDRVQVYLGNSLSSPLQTDPSSVHDLARSAEHLESD